MWCKQRISLSASVWEVEFGFRLSRQRRALASFRTATLDMLTPEMEDSSSMRFRGCSVREEMVRLGGDRRRLGVELPSGEVG